MDRPAPEPLRFDGITIDFAGHRLLRDGREQALEPKAFCVLALLAASPGRVFTRDEILDAVWGHRHVTPGVLNRAVTLLRHALGETAHQPQYLHTVHGVGYRFDLLVVADIPAGAPTGESTISLADAEPPPVVGLPGPAASPPIPPPMPRRRRATDGALPARRISDTAPLRRPRRIRLTALLFAAGLIVLLLWRLAAATPARPLGDENATAITHCSMPCPVFSFTTDCGGNPWNPHHCAPSRIASGAAQKITLTCPGGMTKVLPASHKMLWLGPQGIPRVGAKGRLAGVHGSGEVSRSVRAFGAGLQAGRRRSPPRQTA